MIPSIPRKDLQALLTLALAHLSHPDVVAVTDRFAVHGSVVRNYLVAALDVME